MKEKEYSPELIAEFEELFPEYTEAIKLAKKHSLWLKAYIECSYLMTIHVDEILAATSLEDLQRKARLAKRKQDFKEKLIIEWERISKN